MTLQKINLSADKVYNNLHGPGSNNMGRMPTMDDARENWTWNSVRPGRGKFLSELGVFIAGQSPFASPATSVRGNTGSFAYTWHINEVDCKNKTVRVTFNV